MWMDVPDGICCLPDAMNRIFSMLDRLSTEHKVQKVETAGGLLRGGGRRRGKGREAACVWVCGAVSTEHKVEKVEAAGGLLGVGMGRKGGERRKGWEALPLPPFLLSLCCAFASHPAPALFQGERAA